MDPFLTKQTPVVTRKNKIHSNFVIPILPGSRSPEIQPGDYTQNLVQKPATNLSFWIEETDQFLTWTTSPT